MDDDTEDTTTNTGLSADDALESDESILLSEDSDSPTAPATDTPDDGRLPVDHPLLDSDIDEDELYNEGAEAAADVSPQE